MLLMLSCACGATSVGAVGSMAPVNQQDETKRPGETTAGKINRQLAGSQRVVAPEVWRMLWVDVLDLHVFTNYTVKRTQLMISRCVQSSSPGFEVTQRILDEGCVSNSGMLEMVSGDPKVKIYRINLNSFKITGNEMYAERLVHLCIATMSSKTCPNTCTRLRQGVVVETRITRNNTVRSDPIILTDALSGTSMATKAAPQTSTAASYQPPALTW
ncbi:hypothetical protein GN956_G20304 [Arapaima gigas]